MYLFGIHRRLRAKEPAIADKKRQFVSSGLHQFCYVVGLVIQYLIIRREFRREFAVVRPYAVDLNAVTAVTRHIQPCESHRAAQRKTPQKTDGWVHDPVGKQFRFISGNGAFYPFRRPIRCLKHPGFKRGNSFRGFIFVVPYGDKNRICGAGTQRSSLVDNKALSV